MIQKVASKGINTTKQILKYAQNSNKITNVLEKEANVIKKNIEFPKLKRFLEEAKNQINAVINKIKGNKELAKGNKALIKCHDPFDIRALEEAKKYVNDPRLPQSYKTKLMEEIKWAEQHINEKTDAYTSTGLGFIEKSNLEAKRYLEAMDKIEAQFKNAGKSIEYGDIDTYYPKLTSQGEKKLGFKGHLDDSELKEITEKHLSNEDGIHIRDKFTDWQHGKNLDDMPQIFEDAGTNMHGIEFKTRDINSISGHIGDDVQHHSESSLLEALEKNQAKRNQIEQQADDILGHNHLDDIDDIPDSFFD